MANYVLVQSVILSLTVSCTTIRPVSLLQLMAILAYTSTFHALMLNNNTLCKLVRMMVMCDIIDISVIDNFPYRDYDIKCLTLIYHHVCAYGETGMHTIYYNGKI